MNASDTSKSTQTLCVVVAFDSELNTHQARLTPCRREMLPFLTPGNLVMAYSWNHLTTSDLSRLPNTRLQHLAQAVDIRKKEQQLCKYACHSKAPRMPRERRANSSGSNAEVEARPGSGWKHTNSPAHTEFGWEQKCYAAARSAWLCWGTLLYTKY